MALGTYSDLKTSVLNWMARLELTGEVADFITLAEARLNRVLNPVETDAALTGVVGSRSIDISSISLVSPISLFLVEDGDEIELTQKSDGTFPYDDTPGHPRYWSIDGTNIDFDRLLDQAYSFRFRYRERFALSDATPTNWLLTNYPDIYLAASMLWGGAFIRDAGSASSFKLLLDEGIPEVRSIIAQKKRGVLTVDRALQTRNRFYLDEADL